ncbi:hypothetical protein DSO57_1032885 [Entomophthora muscae]|uniref:Uncharacterized protein n=1 Tax=Entomophthora muscae TaxID=34485 RepID=A0ACC2UK62_9FUNG|nr:hypothetical protein DSO57_1032885 [Entomophthora muscae]
MQNSVFVARESPGLPEVIPPNPNPLDSSLLSQEPPFFYFGEDVFAFLHYLEKFTAGYTERHKILYLLNSLFQKSFDTILPSLGFEYSYWYLQSVIRHDLFYPQDQPETEIGEDYGNSFLHNCSHQMDILKTSQAAHCHTLLSFPEDNSGSVQKIRISTDDLEKQNTKLVNPMKVITTDKKYNGDPNQVINLGNCLYDQYSLEHTWDPDKLSEAISDVVQAFNPKKMVESDAKANHEESKDLSHKSEVKLKQVDGALNEKAIDFLLETLITFGIPANAITINP